MRAAPLVNSVAHGAKANTRILAAKAAKKLAGMKLEEVEKLVLLDSGSTVNAMGIIPQIPHASCVAKQLKQQVAVS